MGRPHPGTTGHTQTSRRSVRNRSHNRPRPPPPLPPQPPEVVPEFIGRRPTETTIIRLSRASPAERTLLARRVIDRFLGYKPPKNPDGTSGPDDSITTEAARTMFLSVIAIRAGMRNQGRNNGDGNILRDMQTILSSCVTRENARAIAMMARSVCISHLGGSIDDRRATARPVMSQIRNHGFVAVRPEIREMEDGALVTATTERYDGYGTWLTITNMKVPKGTIIPRGALVLVSWPLPRPLGWFPGSNRETTYTEGGIPVFIDPSFIR